MKLFFALLLVVCGFCSCVSSVKEKVQAPYISKIIGHKGHGDIGKNGNLKYRANSIPAILNAMQHTDGSEMDLQLSADTTLWLFHDHEIRSCLEEKLNIASLSDQQVRRISRCQYGNELATLEELLDTLSFYELGGKTISLDLKLLRNDQILKKYQNKRKLAEILSSRISNLSLLQKYNTVLEIPENRILNELLEDIHYPIFYLPNDKSLVQLDSQKSYSIAIEDVQRHNLELNRMKAVQLYTANRAEEMLYALELQPEYIQTDNIELAKFVLSDKKRYTVPVFERDRLNYTEDEEYIMIEEIPLEKTRGNFLLEFSSIKTDSSSSAALLVFSCKDTLGNSIYWAGYPMSDETITEFIDANFILNQGGSLLKIYIWNNHAGKQNLKNVNLKLISQFDNVRL